MDYTLRPTDVGPGISTWKRWYRMIRLRCIRTSPDTPSMLRFVADYKGGLTAAPAGRGSALKVAVKNGRVLEPMHLTDLGYGVLLGVIELPKNHIGRQEGEVGTGRK